MSSDQKNDRVLEITSNEQAAGLGLIDNNELLTNFKSLYYLFNATNDTQIQIFKEEKLIELKDIDEIKDRVLEKLENHNTITIKVSIHFSLSNNTYKKFENWEEYKRANWKIPSSIKSCSITWDFHLLMPNYEVPQRHTLMIRMGSEIRPDEILRLMVQTGEDFEYDSIAANAICRVDFVNKVICDEMLNIVEEWYKGLLVNDNEYVLKKFVKKWVNLLRNTVVYIFTIFSMVLVYTITDRLLENFNVQTISSISINTMMLWVLVSAGTVYTCRVIGNTLYDSINKNYFRYEDTTTFKITNGDINKQIKMKKADRSITNQISIRVISSFVFAIIAIFFKQIWSFFT